MAATPVEQHHEAYKPRYIDIAINLADPIFRGQYRGKQAHPDDLKAVIGRAGEIGCSKLIITGSDFTSSREALVMAEEFPEGTLYATAGIHPCSSAIFGKKGPQHESMHSTPCDPDPSAPLPEDEEADPVKSAEIITDLTNLLAEARSSGKQHLVAMGEFGLDYDRLHYCSAALQRHSFEAQLRVAASLQPQLPLFLHSRAAHQDFVKLLKAAFGSKLEKLEKGGVVHSFTGSAEEMRELMDLGLYIGINGCSFKTAENCEVVKEVQLDRLMLETDGPWCEVRPSHEGWKYLLAKHSKQNGQTATSGGTETPVSGTEGPKTQQPKKQGKKNQQKEPELPERWKVVKKEKWAEGAMVKGRNEPCHIERVAAIVAAIKGVSEEEVCEAAWRNSVRVFGLDGKPQDLKNMIALGYREER
ncbi:tatD related DNase domain-containing protein [Sarocladium implicatum]|nr:tatD related DNase domain-containing protein [Sarocladium implicatum]